MMEQPRLVFGCLSVTIAYFAIFALVHFWLGPLLVGWLQSKFGENDDLMYFDDEESTDVNADR